MNLAANKNSPTLGLGAYSEWRLICNLCNFLHLVNDGRFNILTDIFIKPYSGHEFNTLFQSDETL